MRSARLVLLLLVVAVLTASVRIHHELSAALRDHEVEQDELCIEDAPPTGHHDHDAPGAPCDNPVSHCSHGCTGHHLLTPALPAAVCFVPVFAGRVADESDSRLAGYDPGIDHPPKA